MSTAISIVAVALLILSLRFLRVLPRSMSVAQTARTAMAALKVPGQTDEKKEMAARRASVQLFGGAGLLLLLTLASTLPSVAIILLATAFHVVTFTQILNSLISYEVIGLTVVLVALDFLWRR